MANVTLKITFNDDLRRVTLPTTTTVEVLQNRLSQMFSDYAPNSRLTYIDDEDDRVTIQTNEELQEAFRLSQGGVLRLFVEENFEEDEDSDDESNERVHAAICDNCDERIVGIRYKCGNCPDFDLCSSCEKQDGVHEANHLFIKIRSPLSPWASPVRVLLPNLYPQQQPQAQQVPCWVRCLQQRAAQRDQYVQQAQREHQARRQLFEQIRAQRAAQSGCSRASGQCGRPAEAPQRHPFAAFFEHVLQQIEALNNQEDEQEQTENNVNNNNNNSVEKTEQPAPFKVVIQVRDSDEPKEEKPQADSEVEVTIEDIVDEQPRASTQPQQQVVLTQVEPSAPVVESKAEEASVPVEAKSEPVVEEPKRELTRFELMLKTLEDMGFGDRRKNIEVLVKHAGRLEAAVQELISF